ncbi:MAG: TIM barrel protein [Candidatus Woesearchaeota archaeon]
MNEINLSKIKIENPKKLHFGTAGIPLSTNPRNTINAISRLKELKLNAMELEFVRNINVTPVIAKQLIEQNKDQEIILTCHGSYFINLNAMEKDKIIASKKRILEGATAARMAGAWSMTFHAAYYLKDEKSIVYDRVKEQLKHLVSELEDSENKIWLRPETTGKETQFGNIKEIIQLSQEIEQVLPCVDFAHLHARTNGKYNTTEEFREVLTLIEKGLGREGLDNMHIHMSGINYGPKGEKNHLFLEESDFNWRDLLKVWKEYKIKGAVINESPNIEDDAQLMKKYWEGLK